MTPARILVDVDRAALAAALVARLRSRGLDVGQGQSQAFVRAWALLSPHTRDQVYWTARLTLVQSHDELAAFDRMFAEAFEDATLEVDPARRRNALPEAGPAEEAPLISRADRSAGDDSGLPWATLPRAGATTAGDEGGGRLTVPQRRPGRDPGLADVPFDRLDPAEMQAIARRLDEAISRWPSRQTRRLAVHHHGQRISLRRTIALSHRTGGEPMRLVRVQAVRRPRRTVMLCDVSESMQAYATAYLHLMRALSRQGGAETFAFSTSLVRLTPALSHRWAETAVEQATAAVSDRFGGTRIASNIDTLLRSRHGDLVRGAVVLIASDGWDSDPPARLAYAMERLHRRAHRVIWVNPRAAAMGYQPRVAPISAALPFCDEMLAATTCSEMLTLIDRLGSRGVVRPRLSSRA